MRTAFQYLLLAVLAAALAGCAAPKDARILWPPPPAEPRMEFIGVFYSQDEFPKTGFQRFVEGLAGKPELARFRSPFGIVSDGKGKVYVSDPGDLNIRIYDFNQRQVHYLSERPLGKPYGLALDGAGNLYVADTQSDTVLVYGPDGRPLRAIGSAETLQRPVFLALNERLGRLYVSDAAGHKVEVFALADGRHLFTIGGGVGGGEGELLGPQGLAIDGEDRLFVAEGHNARVQVFDADGRFLYTFGARGDQPSQFEQPRDLAFDSAGNLHVVDARKGALLTFTADGRPLLYTGTGGQTHLALGFGIPTSIHIDATDRIYVADLLTRRFAVWQYLSEDYLRRHPVTPEETEAIRHMVDEAEKGEQEKRK